MYVKQQLDDQLLLGQDVKIMYNDEKDKENAPYLASVGKAGLQIEVGPTPQGVVGGTWWMPRNEPWMPF